MNQTEQLVLKVAAIGDMVTSALKPIEQAKKKIRSWLMSKSEPVAEVDETVKTYLQITKATTTTVVDTQAVFAEFESLLRSNRYTAVEIQDMFRAGILVAGNPAALAGAIALKLPGYIAPTKVVITEDGKPESSPLRFHVLAAGRFTGLKDRINGVVNLTSSIERILEAPIPAAPRAAGTVRIGSRR